MALRSLEQLKHDQAAILDAYLRRNEEIPRSVTRSTLPSGRLQWGRVVEIVSSDDDHGPHLVVQGLVYSGSPPALSSAAADTLRCYPAPGLLVSDYAVDEYVQLRPSELAVVAMPIR
jgi:hypothetical protein